MAANPSRIWHRILHETPWVTPVALAGVLVASFVVAWGAQAADLRQGYSGSFAGQKFIAGNCIYCPQVVPPPSWNFAAGTYVVVEWNETNGYSVSAYVGTQGGSINPCSVGEQPSGNCSFVATGGTVTLYFHGPVPATESGYTVDYDLRYVGPGPAVVVPWPG